MSVTELTGRELDAAVAERVMGWERRTYAQAGMPQRSRSGELHYRWFDRATGESTELAEDCDDYYDPKEAWSPSTDIEEAWQVLCEVYERTGIWLLISPVNENADKWVAYEATDCADYDFGLHAYGATAPEAISRAALAATEPR